MNTIDKPEKDAPPNAKALGEAGDASFERLTIATSPAGITVTSRHRVNRRLQDLGFALIYMFPALAIFAVFTFYPFVRSIWLSLNITDPVGEPVRFVGTHYYEGLLNLDGSGDDYLRSIGTTLQFTLMVVPFGI